MSSNTKNATLGGRGGGQNFGGRGCGYGRGRGGNKWKSTASNKKKLDNKFTSDKTTVPSKKPKEDLSPKSNDFIESLFVQHVAPSTELLQSALQGPARNCALLLLTAAHNVKKRIENAHRFRVDPSLTP
eukprot:8632802-Ditylum_brightwellii.AAC.1